MKMQFKKMDCEIYRFNFFRKVTALTGHRCVSARDKISVGIYKRNLLESQTKAISRP